MTIKHILLPLVLLSGSAAHGMQGARRLFSYACNTAQAGIVGMPFWFVATHKLADYTNPNAATNNLPDTPLETKKYVHDILATQNVANPTSVKIKVSSGEFAHDFSAQNSLFNRTIILNNKSAGAIQQRVLQNPEQNLATIPFADKALIATEAQKINQNSTLQQIAAIAGAPVAAHVAVKAVTSPISKVYKKVVFGNVKPQPYSIFRSACGFVASTPSKLALAGVMCAAAYRNIEQRAEDSSNLNREELMSAANYYANHAPTKKLVDSNATLFREVQNAAKTLDPNGLIQEHLPREVIAKAECFANTALSPVHSNATRSGHFWARAQR